MIQPFRRQLLIAAAAFGLVGTAAAQTKWDLPTAYPANNFHTENLQQFAADVDKATGGKLKITVHANASLFKAPEIKRAVQGGQAQAGEILLVNFENEDPLFGVDGVPFLADVVRRSDEALQGASRRRSRTSSAKQGMMLLYTVPWPPQGIYTNRTLNCAADMKGLKWRAYSPATAKIAELVGAQPVTVQAAEAVAGARHRRDRLVHVVGRDRLRHQDLRAHQELVRHAGLAAEERRHRQPGRVRRARQADAGGAAQGRAPTPRRAAGSCREEKNGWYVDQLKKNGMTIVKPSAQLTADMRRSATSMLAEWLRQGRPRRQGDHRRLPQQHVDAVACARAASTRGLYDRALDGCTTLRGAGVLHGRHAGDGAARHRRRACSTSTCRAPTPTPATAWPARGFLALAHTLKRGEHIRVTLLLEHCRAAARRALELWALAVGDAAGRRCSPCYSVRLAWQSYAVQRHLAPATTRRRCGSRRSRWRVGTVVLLDRVRRRAGARDARGRARRARPSEEALQQ